MKRDWQCILRSFNIESESCQIKQFFKFLGQKKCCSVKQRKKLHNEMVNELHISMKKIESEYYKE